MSATSALRLTVTVAVPLSLPWFGSKVASVRTGIVHGKFKRQGRFEGPRPDWKKAWVRLKEGEKVPEFMEGA